MKISIVSIAACSALAVSILSSPAADSGEIIAKVGAREIRAKDLDSVLNLLEPRERAAISADPAALNQLMRSVIVQQLLYQKALEEGYDKRPTVQARIERARQNALAEGYLQSVSQAPADFPSDSDITAFYEANKNALLLPKQFRLAQIFVASPQGASEVDAIQAKRKANDLRRKLDEPGADFAAIARAESQEPQSAARGGEIGLLPESMIQPEVLEKIGSLKAGAVTDPIQLADGWHIVKVLEIQEPRPAGLEEIREQLAGRLRAQRELMNREAFLNNLLRENPVMINEVALSTLAADSKK